MTLRSSDIRDPPKINPAYLEDRRDVACTYQGKRGKRDLYVSLYDETLRNLTNDCPRRSGLAVNLALETLDTRLFHEYGAKVHVPDLEECAHLRQDYRDADYAECVLRIVGLTSHHACGTCRMGADDDAVVDEELRCESSDLRVSIVIIATSAFPFASRVHGIRRREVIAVKVYFPSFSSPTQSERREGAEDNGRQRGAVSNFRCAEFGTRRDGGTRVRHDPGP